MTSAPPRAFKAASRLHSLSSPRELSGPHLSRVTHATAVLGCLHANPVVSLKGGKIICIRM